MTHIKKVWEYMNAKRIFNLSMALVLLLLAIFLFMVTKSLADLAEFFYTGAGVPVLLSLLAMELIAFAYLLHPVFFQKPRLVIRSNPSSKELEAFKAELLNRLNKNPALKKHAISLSKDNPDPEALDKCLASLDQEAEKEIMGTAKRVFIGTALSQNGRLDAIIIFIALCRVIWRVSKIYNQKPHPLELASLYRSVAASTFLAFSFEELDLSAEISGSLGEMAKAVAPALGSSSLPFVGNAMQKFTASCLDGAANSFLVIRVGIIARNAYKYRLNGEPLPKRGQVFAESGALLKTMTSEAVRYISRQLRDSVIGIAQKGVADCGEMGSNLVAGGYSKAKSGISQAGEQLGKGLQATANAPGRALNSLSSAGRKTGQGVKKAGSSVKTLITGASRKTGLDKVQRISLRKMLFLKAPKTDKE